MDISSFSASEILSLTMMFDGCNKLNSVVLGSSFSLSIRSTSAMLPIPAVGTKKWIRSDKKFGPYTPEELTDNYVGRIMAGTWVWENDLKKGDLDSNGKIEIIDVRLLLQVYINTTDTTTYTENQLYIMDMDENGEINIIDVRLLLQEYINTPSEG